MSRMTTAVKEQRETTSKKAVVNFMGGVSFELNPIDTLKMVTASSIFGEPQYYRNGEFAEKGAHRDATFYVDKAFVDYSILTIDKFGGKKTSEVMEIVIDEALKYDYKATLEWAKQLRTEYLMRLNPQVIMVRAAIMTDERIAFTKENPSAFSEINSEVMKRADDVIAQATYYLYIKGSKKNIPNVLKRSWAKKIEHLSRYEMSKYKNKGIGMVDVVRICHANNDLINELMSTGTVEVDAQDKTWESLRANGDSWVTILYTIKMNHMALLRNLRGIFKEIDDFNKCESILEDLKKGVKNGKQFPFRYMSARNAVKHEKDVHFEAEILDALDDCLDIACENLPHLKGNNAFLSDNSGSAWGSFTSEFGSVTVANIDNLSAVIGAANSDVGTVYEFGDRLIEHKISKRQGILTQAQKISDDHGHKVGGSTENGIWLFFRDAIDKGIVYDNIFIYSDMQAGHGGLYGYGTDSVEYSKRGYAIRNGRYIDVAKLIADYRTKVNPKVNVYCIQTAGYDNVLVPENGYRTNILYGWTGKELVYADMMNKFWDDIDARKGNNNTNQN